jgi:hypothetical protein
LIPDDKLFALGPQQRESLLEEYNLDKLKENAAGADACDEARKWYNGGRILSKGDRTVSGFCRGT